MSRLFRLLVPAVVFQSVLFGGAYGTGREVVEFLSSNGPADGLAAIAAAALAFALAMFLTFEVARRAGAGDYRQFFKLLIGPAWFLFEVLFLLGIILVLAVNGAAASEIMQDQFGMPGPLGVAVLFVFVVALNFYGRKILQQSMSYCMAALTVLLVAFCCLMLFTRSDDIASAFAAASAPSAWFSKGMQYALYNVAVIPVLIYSAQGLRSTRETAVSSLLAGFFGILPALVFHLAFMAEYPGIVSEPLPAYSIIGESAPTWLFVAYVIVLFLMIIQTAAGLLHGFNERVHAWWLETRGQQISPVTKAGISGTAMLVSLALSNFGIVGLIAMGYGSMAWAFLAIYIIPLVVIGTRKLITPATSSAGLYPARPTQP